MLIRRPERFKASEITDEKLYVGRRAFIAGCAAVVLTPGGPAEAVQPPPPGAPLPAGRNDAFSLKEAPTKWEAATT